MALRFFIATSALATVTFCSVAVAQVPQTCPAKPGQLFYLTRSSEAAPAVWAPLPSTLKLQDDNRAFQLTYGVPTKTQSEIGAMIIKIARKGSPYQASQSSGNLRIRLVRSAITTSCRGRYASDFVYGLFGNLSRPEINNDVDVADYVYYHATESDAGQFAIYDFHFDYRDQNGRCISTDDKKNGNRQQFLYGSRERDNGLVIANLKANLHSVAQAFGAPGYVGDLLQDSRSQQILGPYFQYGDLETRLYEYHSPESACISFSLQNVRKGETISFMLNKLEQRNVRGRFLPASSRVEQTVTLRVR